MMTSPAAARTVLISVVMVVSVSTGSWPLQVGVQPPVVGAWIEARVKVFWPVLAMTVANSGGLSNATTYGAAPNQLSVNPSLLSTRLPSAALGAAGCGSAESLVLATRAGATTRSRPRV